MLKETDKIEGGLIKEVGTLEALKEQACSPKNVPFHLSDESDALRHTNISVGNEVPAKVEAGCAAQS